MDYENCYGCDESVHVENLETQVLRGLKVNLCPSCVYWVETLVKVDA